jgi:hypothetical protein
MDPEQISEHEVEGHPQQQSDNTYQETVRVPDAHWNPQAALQDLVLESALDDHDQRAATSRILREHALISAASICHLAVHAQSERTRLQAAQFVVTNALHHSNTYSNDYDVRLRQEQVQFIGNALSQAVRNLGLRYGFDPNDPQVRQITYSALSGPAPTPDIPQTAHGGPVVSE